MTELDQRIRTAVEAVVATTPEPPSPEALLQAARSDRRGRSRRGPAAGAVIGAGLAVLAVLALGLGLGLGSGLGWFGRTERAGPGQTVVTDDPEPVRRSPSTVDGARAEPTVTVTIEDGAWLAEIAPSLARSVDGLEVEGVRAALRRSEPSWASARDRPADGLPGVSAEELAWEGLLLPGSVEVGLGDDPAAVLQVLHRRFVDRVTALGYERADELVGLDPYEAVIVASLIEAEGAPEADRSKMARVILNRLEADLPIGVDSVYPYAAQDRDLVIDRAVLEADGPYAQRTRPGLPPTPIGAPSAASLAAAIDPTPGPWLFWVVADEEGNLAFAADLDEHNANLNAARERGLLGG